MTTFRQIFRNLDITPFLGVGLGTGTIAGSILLGGGSLASVHGWGTAVLLGGTLSAVLVQFSTTKIALAVQLLRDGLWNPLPSRSETIERFKSLARLVRRDGLLALEPEREAINDRFLQQGIDRVLDGRRDELAALLEADRVALDERYATTSELLLATGSAASSFGMTASLLGVVQLLWSSDVPTQLGAGVATSLLTTLYGAVLANMICVPLAGKLEARRRTDGSLRHLMISGLTSLADETPPQNIERQLLTFSATRLDESTSRAA